MKRTKRFAGVLAGVCCALPLFLSVASGSAATNNSIAAVKAATDPNPAAPPTPAQQQILDKKIQAAEALLSGAAGTTSVGTSAAAISASLSAASAATSGAYALTEDQNPQKTAYYCGPASVNEALGQMGHWFTQVALAGELGTVQGSGTGWVTGSNGPVQNVMNNHETRDNYYASYVPGSPSSYDIQLYELGLVTDIGITFAPLIGDTYEIPYGPRLNGHPPDKTIFHWFDIYGYTNGGANTTYEDSVYNATSVSWYKSVTQPHATIASSKIVAIVGGRGYVW